MVEVAAPAPGEPMDINTAVKLVLKKSLAHDGLSRGLHEAARAIEKVCIYRSAGDGPTLYTSQQQTR